SLGHCIDRRLAYKHVALNGKVLSDDVPSPGHAALPGVGRTLPALVDDSDLAHITAGIFVDELLQCRLGTHALGHEHDTIDAEIGIDPGLRRHGTDRGCHERTDAADAGHRCRYSDA